MFRAALLAAAIASAAGEPFWERRSPREWSDAEVAQMLEESPWVQQALGPRGDAAMVRVYLATARPIRDAEAEAARRGTAPPLEDPDEDEYREFLAENEGRYVVLAVEFTNAQSLDNPATRKHLEARCLMRSGRKTSRITGHFPPSPSDPFLRLVFPRAIDGRSDRLTFDLYLPGVDPPYRRVEYRLRELRYKGRLEM